MQESSGRDGQNGRQRVLNTRLNARVVVTLLLAFAVVLAGCSGIGGLGGDGDAVAEADDPTDGSGEDSGGADGSDEDSAGDDATTATADGDRADDDNGVDEGDGDDAGDDSDANDGPGSMFGADAEAEDDWFNLSRPGHYEFDLAGMDEESGEQVTGRLVYDVEAASGNELTMNVDYEFGSEQFQSTTTGPADEFSAQLFFNEAYVPISMLQSVSLVYLFEMGFTDPSVGNRKQSSTDEGTQVTEVTEKRTYAGLECFFIETTLDGEPSREGCIRGSEGGIAPYVATYTDEGELELEVELVEYEQR